MHSSTGGDQTVLYPRGDVSRHLERLAPWLMPLSWLYGAGVATARRVRLIDAEPPRGGPHVVSVGNLEVGGSGKTPACIYLLEQLAAQGTAAAYVSRGYGSRAERGDGVTVVAPDGVVVAPVPGVRLLRRTDLQLADEIGDEAAVVAMRCPRAALLIGRGKREAVGLAARIFGAAVVVLDDAFQSWALHRDVDIVLVADPVALADGHLLPSGRLREEIDALARADVVVVPTAAIAGAGGLKPHLSPDTPVLGLARGMDLSVPVSGPVASVAGLARPQGFEEMLHSRGMDLRLCVRYPDHHRYDAADVAFLAGAVERHGLAALVVTEKDWVKLWWVEGAESLPLCIARLEVTIDDRGAIQEMLKPRHQAAASA